MGERKDIAALTDAVTAAGALATELVKVSEPSLSPTSFGELERAALPAAAHEAAAFPVLLCALAATAEMPGGAPSSSLPQIVFDDPSTAWRSGRLLRLPIPADPVPAHAVLSGAPLFRSAVGRNGALTEKPMNRIDAWRMIQRRAADLGALVRIGCHTFRATGDHSVSRSRRHAGKRASHGGARKPTHNETLRSHGRRNHAR